MVLIVAALTCLVCCSERRRLLYFTNEQYHRMPLSEILVPRTAADVCTSSSPASLRALADRVTHAWTALAALLLEFNPTSSRHSSRSHAITPLLPGLRASLVLAADGIDDAGENGDLNEVWWRWKRKNVDKVPSDEERGKSNQAADDMDWEIEMKILAARKQFIETAAKEEPALEIDKQQNPWESEAIEEVYRMLKADKSLPVRLALNTAIIYIFLLLLFRWRIFGPEGVISCLANPLACLTGQL